MEGNIMNKIPVDCMMLIFDFLDLHSSHNYYKYLLKYDKQAIKDIDYCYKIKYINKKDLIKNLKNCNIDVIKYLFKFFKHINLIEKYIIVFANNFLLLKLIEEHKFFLNFYKKNIKKIKYNNCFNKRIELTIKCMK